MKRHYAWLLGALILGTAAPWGCTVDFTRGDPVCGDGVVSDTEACDDGNDQPGDGCTDCVVDDGWQCEDEPSLCAPVCGDDSLQGDEVCDGMELDGQSCTDHGFYDGALACSPDCRTFDTAGCNGSCGDGALSGPEVCDGTRLGGESCENLDHYPGAIGCLSDCTGYDLSGCGGTCGDGVVNGPEVCDGSALNANRCSDLGTFYGGPLACSATCATFDTSGCWTEPRVLINELNLGSTDYIELLNISELPVALDGWSVHWSTLNRNGSTNTGQYDIPAYSLAVGGRVVLVEDPSLQSGDPPVVDGTQIRFEDNIPWAMLPGAAALYDAGNTPRDFVRWGRAAFAPPAGAAWVENAGFLPGPGANDSTNTLSRVPDGVDTDTSGDWCVSSASPAATNDTVCVPATPQGTLLITEIQRSGFNSIWHVELHNPGSMAVELDGWALYGASSVAPPIYLSAFSLAPGAYIEIVDDAPSATPYMDGNTMHVDDLSGFWTLEYLALLAPGDYACVDFVRWGGSNDVPLSLGAWSDTPAPLPNIATGESLGRVGATDTDQAADWCLLQTPNPGAANGVCAP